MKVKQGGGVVTEKGGGGGEQAFSQAASSRPMDGHFSFTRGFWTACLGLLLHNPSLISRVNKVKCV